MKIRFDEQTYQLDAVRSITDIFEGQPKRVSNFEVNMGTIVGQQVTATGIGNKLELTEGDVLENVKRIQRRNGLKEGENLQDWNFTVEMETGTGKTYVYTRTIFELNKLYGFTKFIIVVPGVAIREGVFKSMEMTTDHFRDVYPGQHCHFFKYDSGKLDQVREFAVSSHIEVMIINIDAFRKSENVINQERESLNGMRPIEWIRQTNPIVIIDEPQSVDNTEKAKEAIRSLNPLCMLRYSATHRQTYNLMYKLDAVDAYEKKLVKKIEVLSIQSEEDFNDPYIRLISVSNKNGFNATVEIDEKRKDGTVRRVKKKVNPASKNDLFSLSGEREQYKGYIVEGIDCSAGNESIEFTNGVVIGLGQSIGGVDDDMMKRFQIREAIRTHLDKELRLIQKGIKVLTLFFIDRVENYRLYPPEKPWEKGKYAMMFEEEYEGLIHLPKYKPLLQKVCGKGEKVHHGYFSRDKKGRFKNSRMTRDGQIISSKDDESAFELIMKNKERLLSFEEPVRFIFSHSALKEGWDNPNVFQICTLVETKDTLTKRQKIGRGLRLSVNQEGIRQYDENMNILTVIANESYQEFAENLQREMEDETGVKFGHIEPDLFSTIPMEDGDGKTVNLGYEKSVQLYRYFVEQDYIAKDGKVKDSLKAALAQNALQLPKEFAGLKEKIEGILKRSLKKLPVFNQKERVQIRLNKEVMLGEEFRELWDQIKFKTTYSVTLDTRKLVENSIKEIRRMEPTRARKIKRENVLLKMDHSGISGDNTMLRVYEVGKERRNLPDILRYLQDHTRLKRKTLADILLGSARWEDFKRNPQEFMEKVASIINREKRKLIVDGIKYEKIGDDEYYEQSLFENEELVGFLKANAVKVKKEKSITNYIQYDSKTEKTFAERMNEDPDVKLFVKLPKTFKIDTPLGFYNPDWAVLIDKDGTEKLYFVVETKGSTERDELRQREQGKILCGKKHFEALQTKAEYKLASHFEQFKRDIY